MDCVLSVPRSSNWERRRKIWRGITRLGETGRFHGLCPVCSEGNEREGKAKAK
jgi:hypothetical protein